MNWDTYTRIHIPVFYLQYVHVQTIISYTELSYTDMDIENVHMMYAI